MFDYFRRLFSTKSIAAEPALTKEESAPHVRWIRACRERFGSQPRVLSARDTDYCRLTLSPELEAGLRADRDPLMRILADYEALVARGEIVWGRLVQANQILFDPSNHWTAPANVIYSPDQYFDGRTELLGSVAHGLFARKGTVPNDPEIREFVRVITDEHERIMRQELPRSYFGGRSAYFTTCFIQPNHLPGNRIARPEFPLLVNFAETESVMVLPERFWPQDLVSLWRM